MDDAAGAALVTGYVLAMGHCIGCGRPITFNPHKVPSTRLITGSREPLCAACMGRINADRRAKGLEPFAVDPDAYDALPEDEL